MNSSEVELAAEHETDSPYRHTLNLPQTTFPLQAKLLEKQEEILRRWQAQDIYRSILEERRDAEPFILHDGPPYAAGLLHVGIGMNKVIKDVVAKFRSMRDWLVPLVPGWDCHGLPIEAEVLRGLGARAEQLSVVEIRRLCQESAQRYVQEQKRLFQLLGVFADWDRPFLTMSPSYEAGVLSVLLRLVEQGYVYRDLRPLTWCENCHASLAEAEIDAAPGGEPICGRCGGRVASRTSKQWFVRVDHRSEPGGRSLREKALLELEIIRWFPESARNRMRAMLQERPDWCISRQRWWGVPIPAFACGDCREATLDPRIIRSVRDLVARHGSAVWFERTAAELFPEGLRCPHCGSAEIEKGSDILDVWFESSASWQSMLIADHRLGFPADLVVEGSDQHRGWFQLTLLSALATSGKGPLRNVLTHGFVLNEQRQRMSRSRGDRTSLEEAMRRYPADLFRLFFTSADVANDLALPQDLAPTEKRYLALRNTVRFVLANLGDFQPREHAVHLEDLEPLDLWVLCQLHKVIAQVTADYEAYRFHVAVRRIHEFCEGVLSRIYFEVVKDRLYCEAPASYVRRSAQTVLHSVVVGLVKLLAPILPYTCEEVWALAPGHSSCSSVHLSRWPKSDEGLLHRRRSQDTSATFERFLLLRRALNPALEELRTQKRIGGSADAIVKLHVADGLECLLGVEGLAGLRQFLIVADVVPLDAADGLTPVEGLPGVAFTVEAAPYPTCLRCRRSDASCGADLLHPDLCARCSEVLRSRNEVSLIQPLGDGPASPGMRPGDLARFLRARDIRRFAILNDGGRCVTLALDTPSQEVREFAELQPLADYVNNSPDFRRHAALLFGLGPYTDVLFGIGIHHLNYGTPLGGTREFAYPAVGELIDNLLRLSWGMSLKNAVAELPHGGGKSIIDTCGLDLSVHREFRREIYRDFGQFTATLFGRYICAEDMNNTTADTREMLSACRHVMCLPQGVSGSGNPSRFTALAAWAAAKAGWKFLTGSTSFTGLTLALQGAGNVGRNIVSILIEADPDINRLILADRDPKQIEVIHTILLKRGKEGILEVASSKDPTEGGGAYVEREDEQGKPYVLFVPCDILIPAADGKMISPENVSRLLCRLIVPIANNVYSDNDAIAAALHARQILDVVENNVNWGGAMAAASELLGYDEENVARACLEAFDNTQRLLTEASTQQCPPWEIVKTRATQRVFGDTHPAVGAARNYRFIGDISKGFAEWVKNKWLRNAVDVDPESFAKYALDLAPFGYSANC